MPVIPIAWRLGRRPRRLPLGEHELRDAVGRALGGGEDARRRPRHVEGETGAADGTTLTVPRVDGEACVLGSAVEAPLEPREVGIGRRPAE